jgi:hypothetical protein
MLPLMARCYVTLMDNRSFSQPRLRRKRRLSLPSVLEEIDVMSHNLKHPTEELAELLGDPLPADWQSALAVEARRDHLTALADDAAETSIEWALRAAELWHRGELISPDDRTVEALVDALVTLDRGWRDYVHTTQRDDAGAIVHDGAESRAGSLIAAFVQDSLERFRTMQRERMLGILSGGASVASR